VLRILFRSPSGELERTTVFSTYRESTRFSCAAARQAHGEALAQGLAALGAELLKVTYLSVQGYEAEPERKYKP
jgi:hypothetical protein